MATVDCVRREGLWGLGMDGWVAPRTFEVGLRFLLARFTYEYEKDLF